jgi:hypothetical protein
MPLSSPDGYLDFTNAVPRAVKMVATSNVGIGTSSPQYALDVHGTSNTGPLTVSSLTIADGAIVGDVSISGNLALTSNVTTSVDSNVVVEHKGPHGRGEAKLKKYPEIVFDDTSKMDMGEGGTTNGLLFKQAGYTITASSTHSSNGRVPYRAFNGDHTTGWICASGSWNSTTDEYQGGRGIGGYSGEWIKLEVPHKIKVETMYIEADLNSERRPLTGKLLGSDDDSSWEIIKNFTNIPNQDKNTLDIGSNIAYKYIAFLTETISGGDTVWIDEIEYYGYEELATQGDTSIDTTFTSVMNTPQTTGVQVYVDGNLGETLTNRVTGPDPAGPTATYNSTGKYWELTGALTSNVTVEANTFLEGDQPHSVSVWFNSSNLEANTANTCIFSVSDQEKLDSQNLDLQSNTWHNLTYAYQGEGGSRVTYLDGRKVAEDQAEDTFGEYPPFAMTGYSQGGYVVSASSDYLSDPNALRNAYKVYNTTTGTAGVWMTEFGTFNPNAVGGNTFTDSDGGTHTGHWNKLELPYKLKPSYFYFKNSGTFTGSRNATNWVILGSNNDSEWDLLHSSTTVLNATKSIPITATKGYTYLMFLCKSVNADTALYMDEIRYYGHRENDLVRLPDPTNVLKYPHIAMTGPAQRGYVASASGNTSEGEPWEAFLNNPDSDNGFWHGVGVEYDVNNNSLAIQGTAPSTNVSGSPVHGAWIQLQFPHSIIPTRIDISPRTGQENRAPRSGVLAGSDNGTEWYTIYTISGAINYTAATYKTFTFTNTTSYKYLRLIVTQIGSGGNGVGDKVNIGNIELYGTGVDSVPIQIGGGNIDKVANFRVYDKFIGEDQALEIWDAQKDEFGRAKSSMTLQKGRLGIGTTEPEGRLAILDEPHGLEEFPPRAMTAEETYMEGHGVFKASASSYYTPESLFPWKAFDRKSSGTVSRWATSDTTGYTSGAYTGSDNFTTNGGYVGEWVQIEAPYPIKLSHVAVNQGESIGRAPADGYILGSNNGIDWNVITNFIGKTYSDNTFTTIEAPATSAYRYLRMVITNVTGGTMVDITGIKYFGTREQGQSVLHDGQLTLTKSLTVPRIGPALDADDTPRRDRLVVEYNTSTNPTFEGAVRDTSGRGNDGFMGSGASYDASEKSLVVDNSSGGVITRDLGSQVLGNFIHSISMWVKGDTFGSGNIDVLFWIGENVNDKRIEIYASTTEINYNFKNNQYILNNSVGLLDGVWNHLAFTYNGTTGSAGREIYINGELKPGSHSDNANTLNLESGKMFLGGNLSTGNGYDLDGSISNFKLYDCALTAQEVKTLYDMGRCDEGHHVVNFSKTRVGIGLGDGEAPTYTLDVRGQIRSQGSLVTSFTGQHKCVPEEPMEKGLIVSAKKNKFVKLNGGLNTGKGAITIDESLPIVSLSSVTNDKSCFGVVSSMEEANTTSRTETTDGGVISIIPKTLGDNRATVNSVGEGAIWVVNTGGPLESGDYITTSNVAGYGQKQEDDVLHNYTVAKITMDCDFTATEVPVQVIKREETGLRTITEDVWNTLVDYDRSSTTETQYSHTLEPEAYSDQSGYVPREVTTIVDYTDGSNTISVEEWSALSPEEQETYQSNTTTEIADYTKFVTAEEWSNMDPETQNTYSEAEVVTHYQILRGENILDENGQLQWEDKTGATESPYERRFLDASGAQTDEANAVHIAAFVGCTYHCG